uniref:Uncharacterized protein n=1 Tax=Glossina austeni TaxID=7395 RepID=A0A1A9VDB5_GLOAU
MDMGMFMMMELVESSVHSSDDAQNCAISSGKTFGSSKRKPEDDKYLKIIYKLSDIIHKEIVRKCMKEGEFARERNTPLLALFQNNVVALRTIIIHHHHHHQNYWLRNVEDSKYCRIQPRHAPTLFGKNN